MSGKARRDPVTKIVDGILEDDSLGCPQLSTHLYMHISVHTHMYKHMHAHNALKKVENIEMHA